MKSHNENMKTCKQNLFRKKRYVAANSDLYQNRIYLFMKKYMLLFSEVAAQPLYLCTKICIKI